MLQVHWLQDLLVLGNVLNQGLDLPVGSSCSFFFSLENPLKDLSISFSRCLFKIRRRRKVLWRCNIGVNFMFEAKAQSLKIGVALQLVEILKALEFAKMIINLDQLQVSQMKINHTLQERGL